MGASSSKLVYRLGYDMSGFNARELEAPATLARELEAPATLGIARVWEYFNPMAEIDVRTGRLPHWEQGTVWYFITFRLADALPQVVVDELKVQRERWRDSHDLERLTPEDVVEYHRLFSERYENLLNAGSGSCLLRDPANADIVRGAFCFFDGQRYNLDE